MGEPLQQLLAWERGLLQAESLDQWLDRVATTPDGASAALLLADATHELRPLMLGSCDTPGAMRCVNLVPSLAGLPPQLLAMRTAWRGEYHAADHALLFPGAAGLRWVAILYGRIRTSLAVTGGVHSAEDVLGIGCQDNPLVHAFEPNHSGPCTACPA